MKFEIKRDIKINNIDSHGLHLTAMAIIRHEETKPGLRQDFELLKASRNYLLRLLSTGVALQKEDIR